MNTTIYLFGKFGHSITATINDYTKSYFEKFISNANAPSQIIIHRNGDIMNYGYVRKLKDDHMFGICVQINGQYLSTTKKLFEVFENIVASIAVAGNILYINKNGDLDIVISNLQDKPEEVERIILNSQSQFSRLLSSCRTLPNIDFSTTDSDINFFKEKDHSNTIIKASIKNGYTYIFKEQDYDTLTLGGYRSTLATLNKENETLKKQVNELENNLKVLNKRKKQYGLVTLLTILLFFGGLLLLMNISSVKHLEQLNYELSNDTDFQKKYAADLQSSLNDKNAEVKIWQDKYNKEVARRIQLQEELNKANIGDVKNPMSPKTKDLLIYKNTEFGYEIKYPSILTRQGDSFVSSGGNIKLTFITKAYSSDDSDESIALDRTTYHLFQGNRVTYSAPTVGIRDNWKVLSGCFPDKSIFYEKSFIVRRRDNNGRNVKLMVTAYSTIVSSASAEETKLGNFIAEIISETFNVYKDSPTPISQLD